MDCMYCHGKCVGFGFDREKRRRYKCLDCGRTFTTQTIERRKEETNKRLALYLILSGCAIDDIASVLDMEEQTIAKWKKRHLRWVREILPTKPLLSINTLTDLFSQLEKKRIHKTRFPPKKARGRN